MMYVLDASVSLRWVLPNALSAKALKLRDEYQQKIHELIAPSNYPGEIANALTKAERQKLINVGQARGLILSVLSIPPALQLYDPLLLRATDMSSQTRGGFYDCLYVALAEREQCQLATADDKLVRKLQPQFPFIVPLSSLP
jgi:predicted nucleic acid-binding protein